jgi:voltage-gated potassium channel
MNPPIKHRYFNPRHHIPTFSIAMIKAIFEPLMMYFILAGNLGLVLGAGLFYHLERDLNEAVNTFFDAYWWAVSTITTVGYGDVVPVTFLGKLTGIGLMIGGVILFVGSTAVFVSTVVGRTSEGVMHEQSIEIRRLRETIKHLERERKDTR